MNFFNRKLFYLVSFLEGASVMLAELIGAKLLSPFFGSSLYVWSSVMAITLGGLAAGYFVGGIISVKEKTLVNLWKIFSLSGLSLLLMPLVAKFVFPLSFVLPLLPGVILCTFFLLFFPVFLMGTISPLIVKILTIDANSSGKRAGEVYAVSTVGGIASTFLTGFWLIPQFGLSKPLLFFGFLILVFSLLGLLKERNYFFCLAIVLLSFISLYYSFYGSEKDPQLIYKSEGILGRIEVLEIPVNSDQKGDSERHLLINNIIQTSLSLQSKKSTIDYVQIFEKNLNACQKSPGKALILGLGGGAVANLLVEKGWEVTALEIDERIADVAKKYFFLSPKVKINIDDARHGLQFTENGFDLVLFDMYSAEVAPSHVMSVEALNAIRQHCTENAVFVFNTYGYLDERAGKGNLSTLKTLSQLGYESRICAHGQIEFEDYRGFLIFSSKVPFRKNKFFQEFNGVPNLASAEVIRDDYPLLEYQNALAARKWRFAYLRNFISNRRW